MRFELLSKRRLIEFEAIGYGSEDEIMSSSAVDVTERLGFMQCIPLTASKITEQRSENMTSTSDVALSFAFPTA